MEQSEAITMTMEPHPGGEGGSESDSQKQVHFKKDGKNNKPRGWGDSTSSEKST